MDDKILKYRHEVSGTVIVKYEINFYFYFLFFIYLLKLHRGIPGTQFVCCTTIQCWSVNKNNYKLVLGKTNLGWQKKKRQKKTGKINNSFENANNNRHNFHNLFFSIIFQFCRNTIACVVKQHLEDTSQDERARFNTSNLLHTLSTVFSLSIELALTQEEIRQYAACTLYRAGLDLAAQEVSVFGINVFYKRL